MTINDDCTSPNITHHASPFPSFMFQLVGIILQTLLLIFTIKKFSTRKTITKLLKVPIYIYQISLIYSTIWLLFANMPELLYNWSNSSFYCGFSTYSRILGIIIYNHCIFMFWFLKVKLAFQSSVWRISKQHARIYYCVWTFTFIVSALVSPYAYGEKFCQSKVFFKNKFERNLYSRKEKNFAYACVRDVKPSHYYAYLTIFVLMIFVNNIFFCLLFFRKLVLLIKSNENEDFSAKRSKSMSSSGSSLERVQSASTIRRKPRSSMNYKLLKIAKKNFMLTVISVLVTFISYMIVISNPTNLPLIEWVQPFDATFTGFMNVLMFRFNDGLYDSMFGKFERIVFECIMKRQANTRKDTNTDMLSKSIEMEQEQENTQITSISEPTTVSDPVEKI